MIRPATRSLLALVALALPAAAQDWPGAQTQVELNQCAYSAWQTADAELNSV